MKRRDYWGVGLCEKLTKSCNDLKGQNGKVITVLIFFLCIVWSTEAFSWSWSNSINVSNNSSDSVYGSIAVGGGKVHAVWSDDKTGSYQIYYSSNSGSDWSTPVNISNLGTNCYYPSIAVDINGKIHVAWDTGPDGEIYYASNSGSGWSSSVNITNVDPDYYAGWPSIAVDGTGKAYLVWYNLTAGGSYQIYYSSNSGSGWSSPSDISNSAGVVDCFAPSIAVGSSGKIHVVWYSNTKEIYYTSNSGSGWSTPVNISNNQGFSETPSIVVDSTGRVHVVWYDSVPGDYDIYYASNSGSGWSTPANISNTVSTSWHAQIAITYDDKPVVVWSDHTSGNYDIYFTTMSGPDWTTPVNLSENSTESRWADVATDGSGKIHIVWHDGAPDNPNDIFYRSGSEVPSEAVAHWRFDELSGTTSSDSSGNGNTGTLGSGATWTTSGKTGNAILCSGTTQRVDINNTSFGNSMPEGTIMCWFKPSGLSGVDDWGTLWGKESGLYGRWFIAVNSDGIGWFMRVGPPDDQSSIHDILANYNFIADNWYHAAVTWGTSGMNLYLNGALLASNNYTGSSPNTGATRPFTIGQFYSYAGREFHFSGAIDELAVFNYALSASQIGEIGVSDSLGAPTGLSATADNGAVTLDWNDSQESNLVGYNVYRTLKNGTDYAKINPVTVLNSSYQNTGLDNGTTYYYVVTAVDTSSRESNYSSEVSATPRAQIEADFTASTIAVQNISISTGSGMVYNSYYGNSWRMLYPGQSYFEGSFTLTSVPSSGLLKMVHLTFASASAPGGGYSPVDIIINGNLFKDNYDVAQNHGGSHGYETDTWDVASFLQAGTNTVRVELEDNPSADTHYWIQRLEIQFTLAETADISVTTKDANGSPVNGEIFINSVSKGTGSHIGSYQVNQQYIVSFGDVTGYVTPSEETFVLDTSGKTVTGTYNIDYATISVATKDTAGTSVNGEIFVNGVSKGTGSHSGIYQVEQEYTVSFGGLQNHKTPDPQTFTLQKSGKTVLGVYEYVDPTTYATISVTTAPVSGAISINGTLKGIGNHEGRYEVGQEYTVSFGIVTGYVTPSEETFVLDTSGKTVTGTYNIDYATISVTTKDTAGTSVNGEIFINSVSKGTGSHSGSYQVGQQYTVSFGDLTGYSKPSGETFILTVNKSIEGIYRSPTKPVVQSVSAKYDGDTSEDIGIFLAGVGNVLNTFTADVTHPEGSTKISQVSFTLGGTQKTDTSGSNGWTAVFDMGLLTESSRLTVVARDTYGIESDEKVVNIRMRTIPDWLGSDFESSFDNGYYLLKKFVGFAYSYTVSSEVVLIGGKVSKFEEGLDLELKYHISDNDSTLVGKGTIGLSLLGEPVQVSSIDSVISNMIVDARLNSSDLSVDSVTARLEHPIELLNISLPSQNVSLPVTILLVPINLNIKLAADLTTTLDISVTVDQSINLIDPTFIEPTVKLNIIATESVSDPFGVFELGLRQYVKTTISFRVDYTTNEGATFSVYLSLKIPVTVFGRVDWMEGEWTVYTFGPYVISSGPSAPLLKQEALSEPQDADLLPVPEILAQPSVDSDSSGNTMVAWVHDEDTTDDSFNPELYYSVWNGTTWSLPGRLTNNEHVETNPDVSIDESGKAVMVWTHHRLSKAESSGLSLSDTLRYQEIYYSQWNGISWSSPAPITNDMEADGMAKVAFDPATGNAFAVWVHDSDPDSNLITRNKWEIYYSAFDGVQWSKPASITSDNSADHSVDIAFDPKGNAMAVWVRDEDAALGTESDIEIFYSYWNGSAWGVPSALTKPNAQREKDPTVVFDADRNAIVTWVARQGNVDKLYAAVLDRATSLWATPQIIAEGEAIMEKPVVRVDSRNFGIIVWKQTYQAGDDFFYSTRNLSDSTSNWSSPVAITKDDVTDWMFAVDVDSNNNAIIVWLRTDWTGQKAGSKLAPSLKRLSAQASVSSVDGDFYGLAVPIGADMRLDDDVDKDGMPNAWEIDNMLDPNYAGDAATDADSDGLSNVTEFQYGTDPNNADSDGGGEKDGREVQYERNPLNPDDDDKVAPASVSAFTATAGDGQVSLSWTNPTDADFAGVKVLRKTGDYPTGPTDATATEVYNDEADTTKIDTGLTNGTTYYYAAYAHDGVPNYSAALQANATPTVPPTGDGGGGGGGGCFIATATYGTPIANEVRILCNFRDMQLLTNPIGRRLVSFYYEVSPPIADFISRHERLKSIVRFSLGPIVKIVD